MKLSPSQPMMGVVRKPFTDVEFAKVDAAEHVCHQHSKHKAAPVILPDKPQRTRPGIYVRLSLMT